MAKARNDSQTETEVKHAGTPFAYTVLKKVRVPTLKLDDEGEVFVRILEAITTKQSPVKGEDGVMRLKDIDIIRVENLATKEVCDMVGGAALVSTLKDYEGGNGAYIGKCFRIAKHRPAAGKRFKNYEVDEISVPD